MKIITKFVLIVCLLSCLAANAFAIEIIEPKEGQVYNPDSIIRAVIKPALGENFLSVGIGFDEISFDNVLGAFVKEYPVPKDVNPGMVEFKVEALKESKDIITLTRKIYITLPSTVRLERMEVDPTLMFLQKLPSGSDPKKERIYGTERIGVAGIYSDSFKRDIASSSSGTTYKSSNEEIVTVDTEGLATARKTGQAKIFISNSGKEISVDVIVKEKEH